MRVTLFAVAIALLGAAFADEIPTEDNVLVLSKANFENVISTTDFILVEFYAPWCGHCKSLAPEYAKAATKLNEEESPIKLAKVDATQEQDLAESFGVRGYPTLKFFKNGNPVDYTGGRQADDIVAWLKKKTGPPAVEVTSAEQAKELIAANNVITFGFFPDQATEKAKAFLNVAGLVDDQVFALVSDEKLIEELEAESGDVVLFKNFEEPRVKYDAKEFNEDLFKTWVFVQSMPTIVEFSHETASKIFGGQIKYHLLLFLSKKNGDFEKYLDDLKPVAKNYRDKIMAVAIDTDEDDHQRVENIIKNGDFEKYLDDLKPVAKNYRDKIMAVAIDTDEDDHQRVTCYDDFEKYLDDLKPVAKNYRDKIMAVAIDTDEDDHQRILEFFGMKKDEVPSARLIALEQDMAKYKPASSELSANTIEEFIQSFFAGTLKQHLLSEDLPEDWAAKPVKVLVATNFDEVVFDTNKKVLVEFYAPW
ncbi:Protein disulfide-isomerase [Papilio machaon]|uniref:protein disulfide-isomerase n=1 Tax=Papilio machaon TaxID=76193 RepID=A0A194QPL7_PAPMA|nr:Protein disulfide-isomerase [Papilio machaon]